MIVYLTGWFDDTLARVTGGAVYGYDALSRLAAVSNPRLQASNTLADPTGYSYDGLDRLAATTFPDASAETLSYDANGNVLTRRTRRGDTISFTWDALNRPLVVGWSPVAAQAAPTASAITFNHGYDPTNRRTSQTATDNSWWSYPPNTTTTMTSYTANHLNQYTAVGTVHPNYDGNGNLTNDGTFTYGYDAESRLTSVKQGSTTVATYAYDAQGRRKLKMVGSTSTVYVTDTDNREVLEYDGTSGATQRWYSFGQRPDAVLNQMNVAAGARETMIPDIQGSIIGTLASGGALAKSGYQPFGENPTQLTGTYRYTARRFDPETAGSTAQPSGLYYYRTRMYSPTWGRFPQPDLIRYAGGPNLYAYVSNDPLNNTDPSGLWGVGIAASASAEAGIVALGGSAQLGGGLGYFFGPNGITNGAYVAAALASVYPNAIGNGTNATSVILAPSGSPMPTGQGSKVAGAFAGAGVGFFVTNASNSQSMTGMTPVLSVNTPVGSIQVSAGGGVWVASATVGPGAGLSASQVPGTTVGAAPTPAMNAETGQALK